VVDEVFAGTIAGKKLVESLGYKKYGYTNPVNRFI
jgi:hypothetical protein